MSFYWRVIFLEIYRYLFSFLYLIVVQENIEIQLEITTSGSYMNVDTTTADLGKTSTIDLTASPPIPVNNVTTDPSFNSTEAPATPCQSHMDCPFFQCCARYVYSYYLHSKSRSSTVYFRCHVCLACWLYNPTITSV